MGQRSGGRVVVGLSESLAGYEALRYAIERARMWGVDLIAVRAYECSNGRAAAQWNRAMRADAAAETKRIFRDALGGMPTDVPLEIVLRDGAAGTALTDTASQRDDLLVIGASRRRFGGRVARRLGRRSMCPVIIIPPPEMAKAKPDRRSSHGIASQVERYLTTLASSDRRTT